MLGTRLQRSAARPANVVPQMHRLPLLPDGLMQREAGRCCAVSSKLRRRHAEKFPAARSGGEWQVSWVVSWARAEVLLCWLGGVARRAVAGARESLL
jgi:hypothetical protein